MARRRYTGRCFRSDQTCRALRTKREEPTLLGTGSERRSEEMSEQRSPEKVDLAYSPHALRSWRFRRQRVRIESEKWPTGVLLGRRNTTTKNSRSLDASLAGGYVVGPWRGNDRQSGHAWHCCATNITEPGRRQGDRGEMACGERGNSLSVLSIFSTNN